MTGPEACGWRLVSVSHARTNRALRVSHALYVLMRRCTARFFRYEKVFWVCKIEAGLAVSQIYHLRPTH